MNKSTNRPFLLSVIQFLNYSVVITGVLFALAYLFASDDAIKEFNGNSPLNSIAVALLWLITAGLAGFVAYQFRHRTTRAVAYYVVFGFVSYMLTAAISYYSNYQTSAVENIISLGIGTLVVAYLLFNKRVSSYFNQ